MSTPCEQCLHRSEHTCPLTIRKDFSLPMALNPSWVQILPMGHVINFLLAFEHIYAYPTKVNDCQISQFLPFPMFKIQECEGKEKERCDPALWFGNSHAISQPQGLRSSFCSWHITLVLTACILWYRFCFSSPPSQPPTQYRKCSPALAEGVGKGKPCLIPEHTAEKGFTVTGMSVMLRTSTAIRFFHVRRYPCACPVHGQHQDHHLLPPPQLCTWEKS